jgi:hypothetical protein
MADQRLERGKIKAEVIQMYQRVLADSGRPGSRSRPEVAP